MNSAPVLDLPATSPLAARWRELSAAEPRLRIRDAAARLGVSEAELLATRCGETGADMAATRLNIPDVGMFLPRLKTLGRVMVLTRNEHCVHERHGEYENIEIVHGGRIGLITGKDIDLRLFALADWKHAYAVVAAAGARTLRSIQFFDAQGHAIHKVYVDDALKTAAYDALVAEFRHDDQSHAQAVVPAAPKRPELPDAEIDAAGLRAAWAALKDTHEFFPLLMKFRVGRQQALRLGGPDFVRAMPASSPRALLEAAAKQNVPIMVFAGNDLALQIHSGPVIKLATAGEWFNVLDEDFNLHLRETGIAAAWAVRKPTVDGDVNSLEVFDAAGNMIVQFFGARKPGKPELPEWRALLAGLPGAAN